MKKPRSLTWQEKFDAQTDRFIEGCRRNPQLIKQQFEFYGGTFAEREKILEGIGTPPRRPVGREESGFTSIRKRKILT